jgi:hypothetical protein
MSGKSSKQTGGDGFHFESKVAAVFFLYLLECEPPLDPDRLGLIDSIEFQAKDNTKKDSTKFDDLRVQTSKNGMSNQLFCSIKSYPIVNENGVSSDIVTQMWREFEGTTCGTFDPKNDYLVLFGAPPTLRAKKSFEQLLKESRTVDPDLLSRKLSSNTKKKQLESFKNKESGKTGESILPRVLYRDFDFENSSSEALENAYKRCNNLLVETSEDTTRNFFDILCAIAARYRGHGGSINRTSLVNEIGSDFKLKITPNYEREYQNIIIHTNLRLDAIETCIAGEVKLPRTNLSNDIEKKLKGSRIILIHGKSGSGKSALVKSVLSRLNVPFLFLDCDADFSKNIKSLLSLSRPFTNIAGNIDPNGFIVVLDSIERIQNESHKKILRNQLKQWAASKDCKIQIVITCETEEIRRCLEEYNSEFSYFGKIDEVIIPSLDNHEIESVLTKIPSLSFIAIQEDVLDFIKVPKILDLIARSAQIAPKEKWVGETDLINWVWEGLMRGSNGREKSILAQKLAEYQADHSTVKVPEISLSNISSGNELSALINIRICRVENNQVSFMHDLIGHWARYIIIKSNNNRIDYLRGKDDSPLWYQAVRLYAQSLLEKKDDVNEWILNYKYFCSKGYDVLKFENAFLDALFYIPNSSQVLRIVYPYLLEEDAKVFEKLLTRFIFKATKPNISSQEAAWVLGEIDLIEGLEIYNRQPIWQLWLGIIEFLYEFRNSIPQNCIENTAKICELWLTYNPPGSILSDKVSLIAFSLLDLIDEEIKGSEWRSDKKKVIAVYKAVLLGAEEFPERVKAFALEAAGRNDSEDELQKQEEELEREDTFPISRKYVAPWSNGPQKAIDNRFREVCFETAALVPLMKIAPDVVQEVILATLIKSPGYRSDGYGSLNCCLEIEDGDFWRQPMFYKGPFLRFLRESPNQGIDLIVSFVSFATDRWTEEQNSPDIGVVIIHPKTNLKKFWRGDSQVYFWSRGVSQAPNSVISALMALEAWLLEMINHGQDISEMINRIIERSDSLAIVGVLMTICKFKNDLIDGELGMFVQVSNIHAWELQYAIRPKLDQLLGWNISNYGKLAFEIAKKWHKAPERKLHLSKIWLSRYLCARSEEFLNNVEIGKNFWKHDFANAEDELEKYHLENLILSFDRNHWKKIEKGDGVSYFEFIPPEEFTIKRHQKLSLVQETDLLQILPFQCQQMLEGETSDVEKTAEELSGILKHITKISSTKGVNSEAADFQGPFTGLAAVLLVKHYQWLSEHEDILEKCRNQILKSAQLYLNGLNIEKHDLEQILWATGEFAARGLVALWVRNRSDRELRKIIAGLFTRAGSGIIKVIMQGVHCHRSILSDDYELLMDLAIRRSVKFAQLQKEKLKVYQNKLSWEACEKNYNDWVEIEITSFIEGKKVAKRTAIHEQATVEEPSKQIKIEKVLKGDLNVDGQTLMALYPDLENDNFRFDNYKETEIYDFLLDTLKAVCITLSPAKENKKELGCSPSDFEWWIFGRSAQFLVLTSATKYDEIWKEVLNIGAFPHYWIEHFLNTFILSGSKLQDRKNFIVLWKRIIAAANSHPEWSVSSSSWRLQEAWLNLFGWDSIILNVWNENMNGVVLALNDEREIWTEKFLEFPDCLKSYVQFLTKDAAREIRVKELIKLHAQVLRNENQIWNRKDGEMSEFFVQLLMKCYRENKIELQNDVKSHKAFMYILTSLAQTQNSYAMNLLDKVVVGF